MNKIEFTDELVEMYIFLLYWREDRKEAIPYKGTVKNFFESPKYEDADTFKVLHMAHTLDGINYFLDVLYRKMTEAKANELF